MSLYRMFAADAGCVGIWRINETADELRNIAGPELCADIQDSGHTARILEKMAVRALLRTMLSSMDGEYEGVVIKYGDDGRPYLENGMYISISHTDGYAAVYLSRSFPVGVDIEVRSPRALNLISRFESEFGNIVLPDQATLCWSAKESIFKLLGPDLSDFKESMRVCRFNDMNPGKINVLLTDSRLGSSVVTDCLIDRDFVMTWTDSSKIFWPKDCCGCE